MRCSLVQPIQPQQPSESHYFKESNRRGDSSSLRWHLCFLLPAIATKQVSGFKCRGRYVAFFSTAFPFRTEVPGVKYASVDGTTAGYRCSLMLLLEA